MNDQQEFFDLLHQAQQGDEQAREQCVLRNVGLVWSIVNRFKTHSSAQDLFQIGCLGLMKAINNFDTSYNVMFSTYAVPIILGEIKRYFRDEGQMKISRSLKERYLQVQKSRERLAQKLQREPTYREIGEDLGVEENDVMLAMEANQFLASMDEAFYQKDGSTIKLEDKVEDRHGEDVPMKLALKKEVGHLEQREQYLIYLRYELEYNQEAIAKKMGISQVQVSRLEKKILNKLKCKLTEDA